MPRKSSKQTWFTLAGIVAAITFIGIVLAIANDAFDLWDRFQGVNVTPIPISQKPITVTTDDLVLSTFPLFVGNSWQYSYGTRTEANQGDQTTINETGSYIEKVINVETGYEGKIRIFYIEVSQIAKNYGGIVFNYPCNAQTDAPLTYMMVTDGKVIHTACDRTQAIDISSKLMKGESMTGHDFILPLVEGALWPSSPDIPPRDDTAYQWYVEAKMDVATPSGNFKNCYKIIFRTLGSSDIRFVCPGIGIVASEYHHYGSIVDYRAELTSYNFVSKP